MCTKLVLASLSLCGVLLLCIVLPAVSSEAGEVSGLLGLDVVKRKATQLHGAVPDPDGFGRTRFFPNMRFTCPGTISKLIVVARFFGSSTDQDNDPSFQLLRNIDGNFCLETFAGSFNSLSSQNDYVIYNFSLSQSVSFQDGDSFAISQEPFSSSTTRTSMQYYDGQRAGSQSVALEITLVDLNGRSCLTSESRNDYQAALDSDMLSPEQSLPLLAVTETDAPDCIQGFLSQEALNNFVINDRNTRAHEGEQRLFPDDITVTFSSFFGSNSFLIESIPFDCTGELRKWTVGAERRAGGSADQLPQFQIWRRTDNTDIFEYRRQNFSTISSADLTPTENLNVYEIEVDPPLPFQAGDVLGLFQPEDAQVVLHYTPRTSPFGSTPNFHVRTSEALATFVVDATTYDNNDIPYIRPEIFPSSDVDSSEDCINNFLSRSELINMAEFISDLQTSAKQHIIPEVVFNSSGILTRITFGARYNSEESSTSSMVLQVWRPNSDGTEVTIVDSTVIEEPTPASDLNIYEYSVMPPLQVSAGDVLGIYTPEDSQFSVLFIETRASPLNYIFESQQHGTVLLNSYDDEQYTTPLIIINVNIENGVPSATTTVTVLSTDMEESSTTTTISLITGVVVGASAVLVVAIIVVTVLVIVLRKKQRATSNVHKEEHSMTIKESSSAIATDTTLPKSGNTECVSTSQNDPHGNAVPTEQNAAYGTFNAGTDVSDVTTSRNEAYIVHGNAACPVPTEQNAAYGTFNAGTDVSDVTTSQNEAYIVHGNAACPVPTEQNAAYGTFNAGTDVTTSRNEAYIVHGNAACPVPTEQNAAYGTFNAESDAESARTITTSQNEAYQSHESASPNVVHTASTQPNEEHDYDYVIP